MGRVSRNLLITLVLALIALGVGVWGGARVLGHHEGPATLHEFVHEELDLTAEQKARLEGLEQDFAARRKAREGELRAANAELAAAIRKSHSYSPEVQAAIDRFHGTMGTLQRETVLHVLDMRKVLTPEQASRYDQRITRALTEESR